MNTYQLVLRDADEIEQFFLDATGMKPGYLQLSRGLADLRIRVVELAGVSLIWTRARGRARWRDQMTGGGLHIGFAIESDGPITVRGHDINPDEAQVWMPGREMDLILEGPNLTLDIGVEPWLVEEKGWSVIGEPLRQVPGKNLAHLINACRYATDRVRGFTHQPDIAQSVETESLRDTVLNELNPVLEPWQDPFEALGNCVSSSSYFKLVRNADDLFDSLNMHDKLDIDQISKHLNVPRRTLFHAFNKVVGIGPRQYHEIKRLHALRAQLRKSSYMKATVTSIATELGFTDMGRLATIYMRHFGEKPSETLRLG